MPKNLPSSPADTNIFREYDIRGLVGDEINDAFAFELGQCFGDIIRAQGGTRIVVGYDARLSSPALAEALKNGLVAAGTYVIEVGRVSTPALYFADMMLKTDAGLMVTGSHNPPEYNGVKLIKDHLPFSGDDILTIRDHIKAARPPQHIAAGSSEKRDVGDAYLQALLQNTNREMSLRAVWDPGNAVSAGIVSALTPHLAGEHHVINGEIDGRFPSHHPDPTIEANLSDLKKAVVDGAYDIGFAFDGDGDRLVVVDGDGRTLFGDRILALLAAPYLMANPGGAIATDVKGSIVFFDEVRRLGGIPVMCRTGHSNIKHAMHAQNINLAGEVSGHFFFGAPWFGVDDAHLAALQILNLCAQRGASIGKLNDTLPETAITPEIRLPCADEDKAALVARAHQLALAIPTWHCDTTDGIRVKTEHGWWLLRASNTQPMMVVRAESPTSEGLSTLMKSVADCLANAGMSASNIDQILLLA